MEILELIARNKYGEEIKTSCALSITYQQISFNYKGTPHTLKYEQNAKTNYFIMNNLRWHFKVYDVINNNWVLDNFYF